MTPNQRGPATHEAVLREQPGAYLHGPGRIRGRRVPGPDRETWLRQLYTPRHPAVTRADDGSLRIQLTDTLHATEPDIAELMRAKAAIASRRAHRSWRRACSTAPRPGRGGCASRSPRRSRQSRRPRRIRINRMPLPRLRQLRPAINRLQSHRGHQPAHPLAVCRSPAAEAGGVICVYLCDLWSLLRVRPRTAPAVPRLSRGPATERYS